MRLPRFVVDEQALEQADGCSINDLLVCGGVISIEFGTKGSICVGI